MTTSSRRRDSYHHGALRKQMLRSVGKLIEKQGFENFSVRDSARRAGVSHNAPYRHFRSRDALLAAFAEDAFAELGRRLREAAPRGGREMGLAYVSFALERPQRYRLMFAGQVRRARYPGVRVEAALAQEALQASFRGLVAEEDAPKAAAAAWALLHGLSLLLLDGHFPEAGVEPQAFAREVIGALRLASSAQRPA